MPNLAKFSRAQEVAEQVNRKRVQRLSQAERLQELSDRYASMRQLFQHPAWQDLKQDFIELFEAKMNLLTSEARLTSDEMTAIRSELMTADRIIRLDEDIAERIDFINKKRSELDGEKPVD